MQELSIDLARLQFGLTAAYHYLFVPLTLGLSLIIAIMETIYVKTGNTAWRDATKFWGTIFGINFAIGVATGITMEFQFGTNWSYYSHYVGDIFGAPLALEGMMAFFLEATFLGLFFFGWDKITKIQHCIVTWCMMIGSNFSALWILIANGFMQNPVGAAFNYETMRMELTNFSDLILNIAAQTRFAHTLLAGYVTGAIFVISVSAFYLLRKEHIAFAKRSITVAATIGLLSILGVIMAGDEQGFLLRNTQPAKLAVLEGQWTTQPAPAKFMAVGWVSEKDKKNYFALEIPYFLSLIATRSLTKTVEGIDDIQKRNRERILRGIVAYDTLVKLRKDKKNEALKETFEVYKNDLGYGLLLKTVRDDIENATEEDIQKAVEKSIPRKIWVLFYAFRGMVGLGLYFLIFFGFWYVMVRRNAYEKVPRFILWISVLTLPLPYIANTLGWIVTESGRQPWTIYDILPTGLSASQLSAGHVAGSLIGFMVLYNAMLIVDIYLMVKYVKYGPSYVVNKKKI